jgi:hypothetical protein
MLMNISIYFLFVYNNGGRPIYMHEVFNRCINIIQKYRWTNAKWQYLVCKGIIVLSRWYSKDYSHMHENKNK